MLQKCSVCLGFEPVILSFSETGRGAVDVTVITNFCKCHLRKERVRHVSSQGENLRGVKCLVWPV